MDAFNRLRELGLESNVAELDALGYTVVPPEKAAPAGLSARLLERLLELSADRNGGILPDMETGATHDELVSPAGQHMFFLGAAGELFEEAILNPVALAFCDYMVGEDAVLSSLTSMVKGPGQIPLTMHSDQSIHPIPRSLVCNVSYLLTDYTVENGALCFIPGSHKAMRQPLAAENWVVNNGEPGAVAKIRAGERIDITPPPNVVPVEAPAGSIVAWHGNTWHGAFNRTAPGLRVNLILFFASPHVRVQEPYRELIPDEALERNDERFAVLMGRNINYGFTEEGVDPTPGGAFERARRRRNANTPAEVPQPV